MQNGQIWIAKVLTRTEPTFAQIGGYRASCDQQVVTICNGTSDIRSTDPG
jgi:hypothetical protein